MCSKPELNAGLLYGMPLHLAKHNHTCRKHTSLAESAGKASLIPEKPRRSPRPPATSTKAAWAAVLTPAQHSDSLWQVGTLLQSEVPIAQGPWTRTLLFKLPKLRAAKVEPRSIWD